MDAIIKLPISRASALREKLGELLSVMQEEVDNDACFLPWKDKDKEMGPIRNENDIPKSLSALRKYLPRLQLPSDIKKPVYTSLRICSTVDPGRFSSNSDCEIKYWYDSEKSYLYTKPLPNAENPLPIGVLCFSGNFSNIEDLSTMINSDLQDIGVEHPIGLKLRTNSEIKYTEEKEVEHKANGGTWINQPWKMVHVEADSPHISSTKRGMYLLFNNREKPNPRGLPYRFIPSKWNRTLSKASNEKILIMLNKHQELVRNLMTIRSEDIVALDLPVNISKDPDQIQESTLREILQSITCAGSNEKLFHSVDRTTSFLDESNTVVFQIKEEHQEEAGSVISVLQGLVEREYGLLTRKWFTKEAINRGRKVKWNADGTYETEEDQYMGFVFEDLKIIGLNDDNTSLMGVQADDASFWSFRSRIEGARTINDQLSDSVTTGTATTMSSTEYDTRIAEMKENQERMRKEMEEMRQLLEAQRNSLNEENRQLSEQVKRYQHLNPERGGNP